MVETNFCGQTFTYKRKIFKGIFQFKTYFGSQTCDDENGLAQHILHYAYAGRIAYNGRQLRNVRISTEV